MGFTIPLCARDDPSIYAQNRAGALGFDPTAAASHGAVEGPVQHDVEYRVDGARREFVRAGDEVGRRIVDQAGDRSIQIGLFVGLKPDDADIVGLQVTTLSIAVAAVRVDESGELLIDTGCYADGYVEPGLFKAAVRGERDAAIPTKDVFKGKPSDVVEFPSCVWGGETYTDVIVGKGPQNLIGMRFLARHLVTFNFPEGVMYLKCVTSAPLQ